MVTVHPFHHKLDFSKQRLAILLVLVKVSINRHCLLMTLHWPFFPCCFFFGRFSLALCVLRWFYTIPTRGGLRLQVTISHELYREKDTSPAFRSEFVLFSCQLENPGRQYWECLEGNAKREKKDSQFIFTPNKNEEPTQRAAACSLASSTYISHSIWKIFYCFVRCAYRKRRARHSYKPFKSLEVWLLS